MAKLGKFSTGLSVKGPPMAKRPSGTGNMPTPTNMMSEFNRPVDPRSKPKPTYAGAAPDPIARTGRG